MLKAGDIAIHFLNDGLWWDDGGAQFGIVPREVWQREKRPNQRGRITLSLTCPLIVTRSELILVDTGIGNRLSPREQTIFYAPARQRSDWPVARPGLHKRRRDPRRVEPSPLRSCGRRHR